ncbi:MAG: ABC transporter ATP-binding protein [Ruminococcaceae bacterium]|nr:ABC transporter ATP-binding protein [Oscillospiraceae bacterium]
MDYILECLSLTKKYSTVTALDKINLSIPKGKIIGLLGPNGSGKTTLIKLASGLLVPTAGEILVNNMKPCVATKKLVSYLPDNTYLRINLKVRDVLEYFNDFYADFNMDKAREMLKSLDIDEKRRLKELSKGGREKVQLILVMSREAKLYMLDEPIAGVDPAARDYILSTVVSNYSEGATVILSTHLLYDIEKFLDEFIIIKDGKIAMQSTVDEVREEHGKSLDLLFREVFKC